jgi:hypothetical protein
MKPVRGENALYNGKGRVERGVCVSVEMEIFTSGCRAGRKRMGCKGKRLVKMGVPRVRNAGHLV